ncbi:MAG: co-chaperone GroES [Alphaproteobacteria bacterium]|nr:co-chaperone GroES [Alphaproteobacteria bacterium]
MVTFFNTNSQYKENKQMINAVADRIFIRLAPDTTATSGGIILVDDYHRTRNIGVVESIGDLVTSVKVGDKVLFHQFDELPTPDDDLVVVRENSILGVYEDE